MDKLALALARLVKAVDPYEFNDNGTEEEAYEETRRLLSSDEGMRALAGWIDEMMEV